MHPAISSCVRQACIKSRSAVPVRSLTTCRAQQTKQMPPRPPPIDEGDITEVFLKGSGPGGQKINKTSSAVQLKHLPTGIVLKVQATRSREQNRKIARQMLAERLEVLEKGDQSRVAVVAETKRKKKNSAVKKSKRKYKLLEGAKSDYPPLHEKEEVIDILESPNQPARTDYQGQ